MFNKSNKIFSLLILLAIGWYVILAATHYFNQRPMWNDEECVFDSIKGYSPYQIFHEPLRAFQVFPRVYLYCYQQISEAFNYHLLSLRFLSFLAMMAAFCVWFKIMRYELKSSWEQFLFVTSWAGSITLIYYAAELKQYSMDVLAAGLIILFLYHQKNLHENKHERLTYYCLLVLLPLLALFSYPAIFFLMIPLVNLFILSFRHTESKLGLSIYVFSLGVCMAIAYQFDIRLRPVGTLSLAWGDYFISVNSLGNFSQTFTEGVNNLFSRWYIERPKMLKMIGRVFVCFGLINLFYSFRQIKNWKNGIFSISSIAVFVFFEMVLAGVLKKYPFTVPRTSLFFCPIVLYLTIDGFNALKGINKNLYQVVTGLYFIFLVIVSIGLAREIFSGDLGAQSVIWKQNFLREKLLFKKI